MSKAIKINHPTYGLGEVVETESKLVGMVGLAVFENEHEELNDFSTTVPEIVGKRGVFIPLSAMAEWINEHGVAEEIEEAVIVD